MSEPQTTGSHQAVPILTYHSLDESEAVTSVAPRAFREHMRSLARRGFAGISLSELLDGWDGIATLPARPVVLTFDDGFANLFEHATPLLVELGFRATIFAVSGRCGLTNDWPEQAAGIPRLPLLAWSQLAEMADAGFEVGAHSVTHRLLPKLSPADAAHEIIDSKSMIENQLGRAVQTFAYPFGLFRAQHYQTVREHFRSACSVQLGKARANSDRHQLPRLDVYYLRRPALFQLLETFPGEIYIRLRGIGRSIRGAILRGGHGNSDA